MPEVTLPNNKYEHSLTIVNKAFTIMIKHIHMLAELNEVLDINDSAIVRLAIEDLYKSIVADQKSSVEE